uniref:Death domain-containing protein n=1 Tax=Amphimedon queenslandica TaxID=400682 RepID=A0A1X7V018_AMPQE
MEGKPTLNELVTHVDVSTKWLRLGVILELDMKDLKAIEHVRHTINERLQDMYDLWLETNPNATRGQLIKALGVIRANSLADEYKKWISSTGRATATSKDTDRRRHSPSVSKQRECQTDSPQQEVAPAVETRGSTQEEEKQSKKEDRGGVRQRTHNVDQSQQQQQLASHISQTKKGGFLENYRKEIGFTLMIIIIIIFLSFILYCFPDFKGPIIGAFVTIAIGTLSALVNHCLKSNVPGSADIKIEPLTTLTQST